MARYSRYRRRRRRTWIRPSVLLPFASAVAVTTWWFYLRPGPPAGTGLPLSVPSHPALTTDRPETIPETGAAFDIPEKGAAPEPATPGGRTDSGQRAESLVAAGKQALQRGDVVTARTYFSEAVKIGVEGPQLSLLHAELTRLGNETVFSLRVLPDDPFVERYVVQPGDTLGKIAKASKVSAELLAEINQVRDIDRIRAGQTIKIIKGPFHAVVDKSTYSLDVYLGNTFVKHYKVGLGTDGGTPIGEWRVATKLKNPTYYPPRGGTIVAADDPDNPLAERWIGLEGIAGEAAGQLRYGIHGTIEPETIGRNVSMGCIRMYNEDVEALYTYLVEKHSKVTVRD